MEKVRFSCPRCNTVMQTVAERVGRDVACPNCSHSFRLVDQGSSSDQQTTQFTSLSDSPTKPPASSWTSNTGSTSASYGQLTPTQNWESGGYGQGISSQPQSLGQGRFQCPYCQTREPPIWKSEVSTIGWIVFAILLVTTCVFCFVGLLIRDRYRVCSRCRVRLE